MDLLIVIINTICIYISDSERNTKGGHLKDKNIVYTTAEVVIGELPKLSFSEVNNPGKDRSELHIEQKKKNRNKNLVIIILYQY